MLRILACCLFSAFYFSIFSQGAGYVTLKGKQFYDQQGTPFFPMVMNYTLDIGNYNGYFITPDHSYNLSNEYECVSMPGCTTQIQADFNHIVSMGFNSVRFAEFYPRYVNGTGMVFKFYSCNSSGKDLLESSFTIHPTVQNDPGMQQVFQFYDLILSLANSTINNVTSLPTPLKLIFIIGGIHTSYTSDQISEYNDFLIALSSHLASAPNNNAFFAYDLINEPCFAIDLIKTKREACEMISEWYSTCKTNDPNHLVTIGSCAGDVMSFDPGIIKVDFISMHDYPSWGRKDDYEDRRLPAVQQRLRERVANTFYWMNENATVPWIVGETGFMATSDANDSNNWYGKLLDGSLADEEDYVDYSLQAVCNCGGSGYSWWNYQDVHYFGLPGDAFGLLYWDAIPSSLAEKPAVSKFRQFNPVSTGPCPVSRSPYYDDSKLYYNPFQLSFHNSNTITGTITDQDGNPIQDALIGGHSFVGIDNDGNKSYDYHFTYSDENGYFEISPYVHPGYTVGNKMGTMDISAAGAERRRYIDEDVVPNWWCKNNCGQMPAPNSNAQLTLERVKFSYDNTLNNITVSSGTNRNFKGYNSLTISDITIKSAATSDIYAKSEVHITGESHLQGETHIFCAPAMADCSDYSSYIMQYKTAKPQATPIENETRDKTIELSFNKLFKKGELLITPNPNTGQFHIHLGGDEPIKNLQFEITNLIGEKIFSATHYPIGRAGDGLLDLSKQPKGIYFLKVETITDSYFQKIIIQ